jgi:large subunit ribosomal protein L13
MEIMKTHSIKQSDIKKKWVIVDAADQTLGRLATEVARVLRGKHKATFTPHLDTGDNVIVINAAKVKMTGTKLTDKFYHHHTGYIGGIKQKSASLILETNPERLISIAVRGMLPKNTLGDQQLSKLKVYKGAVHPHVAQQPKPFVIDQIAQ